MAEFEKIVFESVGELRNWLKVNHKRQDSVWMVRWKKNSGKPYLSYDDIVDQLICFGWVDSLPRKLDEYKSMLLISPRNPKSNWSGINKKRVEKLIEKGLMDPSGMDLVNQAKKNGAWNFLDEVEKLIIPDDLAEALKNTKNALYYFNRFPDSSKRGILEWIKNAKQPATRLKRIEETALKSSKNIKANHPEGRDAGPV